MNTSLGKRRPGKVMRNPFGEMFSQNVFDDLLEQYFNNEKGELNKLMNVSMDVAETDKAFEVKIDLPGIDPDNVEIHIDNNTLTIRGERTEESEETGKDKQFHRIERYQGSFARSVVLPATINEDETAAEFKDGVLKIVIPKCEEAKPRKIAITR